jgi:hypothetical protein
MRASATLVLFFALATKCHAVEVHDRVPDGCEIVESFTLFTNAKTRKAQAMELYKKANVEFTGVVFSEELYSTQREKENEANRQWLENQPQDLMVDPNFYGVPRGVTEHKGVLVNC